MSSNFNDVVGADHRLGQILPFLRDVMSYQASTERESMQREGGKLTCIKLLACSQHSLSFKPHHDVLIISI